MKFSRQDQMLTVAFDERIDSTNVNQVETDIFSALTPCIKNLQIDAANLTFISSAGLRVLLKLAQEMDEKIMIFNVSRDVYEIFDMTGFTEMFDVRKSLRELSTEGLEVIGAGGYGTVYRLNEDTILKVYRPGIGQDFIEGERITAKKAFVMGIPTAIPYDTVKVGAQFGVVYEMVEAKTVAQLIDRDHTRLPELGALCATALRQFHQFKPAHGDFPRHKDKYHALLERISVFLTPEEKQRMLDFLISIPDRDTFLHGDYNPKNVMIRNGELILIDIGAGSVGHPVFDLAGLMLVYLHLPHSISGPRVAKELLGFDLDLAGDMWQVMISAYFDTKDPAELEKIRAALYPVMSLNILFQGFSRGIVTEEAARQKINLHIRERFFNALDSAPPISTIWPSEE